jgi:hypothetical protein
MDASVTLSQFQAFVASHADRFDGVRPHPAEELDRFEEALGHPLPASLRWLLGELGYSECCGVSNFEEAIAQTLACRQSIELPANWLLLNDWGDAGIVLLDLPTGRVCWCGAHNAGRLAREGIDSDADWFEGYPEWVVQRLEDAD